MRHFGAPVVAVAGEQAYLITLNAREDPVTIELDFVAPFATGWGLDQRRQLRLQLRWQLGFTSCASPQAFGRGCALAGS
ncbi:hypothetical protein D3C84_1042860 [compost metagenome]